tara:strand:- start:356 stop:907 length:552 start_codon:yes stop_codon:yes gene_type:complete
MEIIKTTIKDLVIIKPDIYDDQRGYFMESFNRTKFNDNFQNIEFVQDNESKSEYGVLRGLHFQNPPFSQSKLVRVIEGVVLDVALDLRQNSSTFGKCEKFELSAENKLQLFIPKGFAHGFVVLSEFAIFSYKVDNYYSKEHENGIIWNDSQLDIDWKIPIQDIKLSEKDKFLINFNNFKSPFS